MLDRMDENRHTSRQGIVIQNTDNKEKGLQLFKGTGDQVRNYNGLNVSTEALEVKRPLSNAFKILKENYPHLQNLYPTRLSMKFESRRHFQSFKVKLFCMYSGGCVSSKQGSEPRV